MVIFRSMQNASVVQERHDHTYFYLALKPYILEELIMARGGQKSGADFECPRSCRTFKFRKIQCRFFVSSASMVMFRPTTQVQLGRSSPRAGHACYLSAVQMVQRASDQTRHSNPSIPVLALCLSYIFLPNVVLQTG
jgi:hypothetical protein